MTRSLPGADGRVLLVFEYFVCDLLLEFQVLAAEVLCCRVFPGIAFACARARTRDT